MKDYPKTLAAARLFRYGRWAGNPSGNAYREGYCIKEIMPAERGPLPRQCGGHRRDASLWCAIHMPGAAEARAAKRPPTQFERAMERIKQRERDARNLRRYERALSAIAKCDTCALCRTSAQSALARGRKL